MVSAEKGFIQAAQPGDPFRLLPGGGDIDEGLVPSDARVTQS